VIELRDRFMELMKARGRWEKQPRVGDAEDRELHRGAWESMLMTAARAAGQPVAT